MLSAGPRRTLGHWENRKTKNWVIPARFELSVPESLKRIVHIFLIRNEVPVWRAPMVTRLPSVVARFVERSVVFGDNVVHDIPGLSGGSLLRPARRTPSRALLDI
jgi:hypothetical protein